MVSRFAQRIWRLLITPYEPQPQARHFVEQAQTQENAQARVSVAVLDAPQSEQYFGVALARRGIQPVYLRVENRSQHLLRLQLVRIDPNYFTPLEAAAKNHFSFARRLSAFGFVGWLFLPLLGLVPLKLITAMRANRRMDEYFRAQAFPLRPIGPGCAVEGFVFTPLDAGTKLVRVCLHATGELREAASGGAHAGQPEEGTEFTFSVNVPGIAADYLRRDFAALRPAGALVNCELDQLVERLRSMPPAVNNAGATRAGDPVNLVVIGEFETLLASFASRWDESESITLATCWKTVKAFLLGSQYRYSPVSPLYLFGRSQDIALQRTRHSINDRLHLRLWLTPLVYRERSVWVGQVSRDIGVRFTTKVWNLTTHRIDPDVDEARDYVIEDLLEARHVEASGYVDGVGACRREQPRRNLTGDPYYTDGKRAAILLSTAREAPRYVAWS